MDAIFLKLLNISFTASWLILAIVAIRFLLKNSPKTIWGSLWVLVGIRLICPISFESSLSLIPSAKAFSLDYIFSQISMSNNGVLAINQTINQAINQATNPVINESLASTAGSSVNLLQSWTFMASVVWVAGMVVILLYTVISYLSLRRRVSTALQLGDNLWNCDAIKTPFILGIIRPRIYLPSDMDKNQINFVVAHEKAHLKRHDHWWKPLGFALLAVYWFNPFIWLAYILFCRDIELACDESVVKEMELVDKKAYSQALLLCSTPQRTIAACPLAFGEVGVKQRIKNVLSYKKPSFWVSVLAVLTFIVLAVCFLTNPKVNDKELNENGVTHSEQAESCVVYTSYENSEAVWYSDGQFDFDYEELPTITVYDKDTLVFDVNWECDTLIVGEDYYEYGQNSAISKRKTYELPRNKEGIFELEVKRRNDSRDEEAVYYIVNGDGKHIIKVLYPVDSSAISNVEEADKTDSIASNTPLTLDDVKGLSQKGENLVWEDFDLYQYIETGSGLYIRVYEIDQQFSLWIGGASISDDPMYIYLKSFENPDDYIDIRTEDVNVFISKYTVDSVD